MADIRLVKPQANAVHNVPCATGNRFVLDFPSDAALFAKDGDDLVLSFEDGSSIRLQDFYTTYSKEEMPSFEMEGAEISGEDFFAALGNPDLMPAAGPSAAAATRGGGFNQYGNVELLQGIDRLGGLDISFNWGQEHEDDLYAYGHRDIDYGVSVVPVVPGILDPDIPVVDDPDNPNDGGTGPVVDRLEVWEEGLANGSNPQGENVPTVAHGGMNISAPDGVATIVIGKVTVYANGHLVLGSDGEPVRVETGEGYLQVTGFNPATGRLEYTYTLTDSTQEHDQGKANEHFTHLLPVTVTDSDGDRGSSTISVVIRDDEPTADNDTNSITEGDSEDVVCSGNVLNGTIDKGTGTPTKDIIGADGHMNDASKVSWTTDGLESQGENTYQTKYGTIKLNADGTYEYTLDGENEAVRELLKDEALTETFTYTITDADGDTDDATLTITINGASHDVSADISSEALEVDEAGLQPDGSLIGKVETEASASMTITAHDGLSTITIGGVTVVRDGQLVETVVPDGSVGKITVTELIDHENGTWTLKYTYTLEHATTEHEDSEEPGRNNLDKPHTFEVVVEDQDGNRDAGHITVNIVDDVPEARNDWDSVTEKDPADDVPVTTTGNVIDGTRGDGQTSEESGKDTEGADSATVTGIANSNGAGTEADDGAFTIEGEYGTLTIWPNGTYTYTLDETNIKVMELSGAEGEEPLKDSFTYTLTDADGDADTAELTITIKGKDHEVNAFVPKPLTVDEAALPDGSKPGSGEEVTATGSFDVVVKDGLGKLLIEGKEVELQIDDNGTVTVDNSEEHYADPRNGEGTGEGYLTIDSVVRNEDGYTYTVKYTYHLTEATQEHEKEGADQLPQGGLHSFGVTVVDQNSSEKSGTISIDIVDDVPVLTETKASTDDVALVKESELTSSSKAVGTVDLAAAFEGTVSVGADGIASEIYALKLSGASVKTNLKGLTEEGTYDWIYLVPGPDGSVLGVTDVSNQQESLCFKITIDKAGTATLKLLKPVDHGEEDEVALQIAPEFGSFTVEYTVTDKDDDSVSTSMDLGTGEIFRIEDWKTTVDAINSADLTVDESYTVTRPIQNQKPDRLSSADGNNSGATSNQVVFDAYELFEIKLGADDMGLEGANGEHPKVAHTFTLGFTKSAASSADDTGMIFSGLYGLFDEDGVQQREKILLSLNEETNTITGLCDGKEVFTLAIDQEGKMTLTMLEGSGVSIVHEDQKAFDDIVELAGKINVTLTVTDRDGDDDSATANVTLKFEDDGPALKMPTTAEEITSAAKDEIGTLTGQMTFDFGADGAWSGDDVAAIVVTVQDNGTIYKFNCVKKDDGIWKDPDTAEGYPFFSIGQNGNFTYSRPLTTGGTDTDVVITVSLKDGDGDTIIEKATEYVPFVEATGDGELKETGVAGCTEDDPNEKKEGTYSASGTISLAQSTDSSNTDSDKLTLQGWSATLKHTTLIEISGDGHNTEYSEESYSGKELGSLLQMTDGKLVLYLKVDTETDKPVLSTTAPGTDEDFYGTLTFTPGEDPGSEWKWAFDLEHNQLTNSMTEQESIELNFDFRVSDGMLQGGGALNITIQGTNDRPRFTWETKCELPKEAGDAVVNGSVPAKEDENPENDAKFEGAQLEAWDPDTDNGSGDTDVTKNQLHFSVVQDGFAWDAGQVSQDTESKPQYNAYRGENSEKRDLLESTFLSYEGNGQDGIGNFTSITTNYGILKVYDNGRYTYEATDTSKIGKDEYVTETFTIRVTDAHGSYSEKQIVITLRDTDDALSGEKVSLTVKEAGVAGDDTTNNTTPNDEDAYNKEVSIPEMEGLALFTDVDVNDTLKLTFGSSTISQGEEEQDTVDSTQMAAIKIGIGDTPSDSCYLVATQSEGEWRFAWTQEPEGADVVGTLIFVRDADTGAVMPRFTLSDDSDYLDQLSQGDMVTVTLPLTATSSGDEDSVVNSELQITIAGTNDRPTMALSTDKTQLTVNELGVSVPSEGTSQSIEGKITASDVDWDYNSGISEDEPAFVYTLHGFKSDDDKNVLQPDGSEKFYGNNVGVFEGHYTTIETTYGTMKLHDDGTFTYTLHEPGFLEDGTTPNAVLTLAEGQSVTETFIIRVTDNHGSWTEKPITITINGTNDAPVLTINNLEVHATEDNISDKEIHDGKEDHSSVTVTAEDYDYGHELTYCFHDDDPAGDTQSVTITAGQLLDVINKQEDAYSGSAESRQVLQALLKGMKTTDPIATLKLSETGELTLDANQESAFIQALNDGDNLTFNLSDIAPGLQVVAKDEHGAYSKGENVTLVLHGNDDDYTPVSVVVPHVKEEGVYRNEDDLVTGTHDAEEGQSYEQPGYGQHQISNAGKFTINDRDAGQISFTHDGKTWMESDTTIGDTEITFDEGTEPAGPMYVLGTYGYYVIDLSSTMDENGVKTFNYTYRLYSDKNTPNDVKAMVDEAFAGSDLKGWEGRLEAVDSIAQGEQVRDSVEITVSTGGGDDKTFTLESVVSGSNDSPEITGVATVDNPEEGTALTVSKNETSKENTMYLEKSDGSQTLHITMQAPASGESSHFVGRIVGVDPDKDTEDGSHDDGTQVVNYAFVNTGEGDNSSHNVWSISEDGESASSEYGYITIDADGVFHIHLYEDAAKALGAGKLSKEDIFEGLGVRCIDDLGATSNIVHLSGHLVGVDDKATAIGSREDLWEGVHEHDTSIPAQDPAPHDKPLAESGGKVTGKVVVTDPDSSDTFLHTVTVTIDGQERTLVFDEDGNLSKVDDENTHVLKTDKGEFGFTLKIEGHEATLTYTYKVNDQGLAEIDKLDDGDFVENFESIDVSFTSITKNEDGSTTTRDTSSATISIDVHGTNDAPVIETVQTAHGEPIKITDDSAVVSGGTLKPKEQTSGKITATDPDEGETAELTYGILIYTDEENKEHIVYGQTGEDGRTQYFAVDGFRLPDDINLDNLTFTNHADLEHGSIYVDDDGNYTYSRYPKDGEEGSETVYITVRDPDGAMDHVKINFELKPGDGGRLPDVTMKGEIPLEVIEPSDKGDRVHVGDEESSASSFTEGIVEKFSITVSYYQDKEGYHLLDKDENGNWVHLDETPIPEDAVIQTAVGNLKPTGDGSYSWVYTDKQGETLEDFTVPLDIRLTPEGEEYGWDDGTYSLQTGYGTVYVDRVTGELRFELDSRADTLNAGEVHSESVVIWINGSRQEVSLDVTVTGTADASEVETEALSVDLEEAGEDATVEATDTLTIDDIDNDAGAEDRHTLAIEVTGEDGEPKHLDVVDGTTIYVMAQEGGTQVYTDVKPEGDDRNSCYGELSFSQNEDGSYDYTFTAYSDSTVSKEIQDNEHLDLRIPVLVTDFAPGAGSYPVGGFDADHYKETKTEAVIAITVTGKADAPAVTDSTLDITEEGTTLEGQGDGSHSVTGSLEIVDYDDSGVTVTGIEGKLEEGQAFENGSTVVPGKYGTLVLHNDGSYTYTVNYDEVQNLAQGESVPDIFTVAVGNDGGQSLATITVNVHGTNDLPTVTVTPVLTVQEQHGVTEAITVSGRVEAQDIDTKDDLSYGFSTGEDSGELVTTLYVVGTWEGDELVLSTSATEPTDASGLVGRLTMGEYGMYTFRLEDSETTRSLPHGESAQIVVQAGASDSHSIVTRPVTITIKGSNEAPEVTTNITIDEDTLVESPSVDIERGEGGYTATDADKGTTLSYTFSRDGEYRTTETGTITIGDTQYQVGLVINPVTGAIAISYEDSDKALQELINALGKGETLPIDTNKLQVVVQDGEGGRTSSELTLTIQGENDAPEVTTNITIGEDDLVGSSSVQILPGEAGYTATDADRGTTLSYTFSRDGEYRTTETGTITIEDTQYQVGLVIDPVTGAITISYEDSDKALQELINALGKDETLAINTGGLQVVVQDGEGVRTPSDLTLTIQGANDAPVIASATMNNNEGSLTFSDVDTLDKHTISVVYGDTSYLVDPDNPVVTVPNLGSFTFTQTGDGWTYSFIADSDIAESLPEGETGNYNFQLQVSDGTETVTTTQDLSVTVTGTGQTVEEEPDTNLADDMALFANSPDDVLDTLAPLSNSQDDTPADIALFSGAPEDASSQSQDLEDQNSPFENALRLLEDLDSEGTELLFARDTYSLADGEEMYSLSPDDPEENTIDIVAYDSTDYMVDGGEGVSFMVSDNEDLTMDDILQGDGQHGPIVSNIDVLITGEGAESLTNMDQLARDYGIAVDKDANSLTLDESWQKVDSGHTDTQVFSNGSLTLETSLDVSLPSDDLNVQAAMNQANNN